MLPLGFLCTRAVLSLQMTARVCLDYSFHTRLIQLTFEDMLPFFLLSRVLQFRLSCEVYVGYHRLWLETEIFFPDSECLAFCPDFPCLSLPFLYTPRLQKPHEAHKLNTSLSLLIYKWKKMGGAHLHMELSVSTSSVF